MCGNSRSDTIRHLNAGNNKINGVVKCTEK